jgi:hypothetical protein
MRAALPQGNTSTGFREVKNNTTPRAFSNCSSKAVTSETGSDATHELDAVASVLQLSSESLLLLLLHVEAKQGEIDNRALEGLNGGIIEECDTTTVVV